MMPAETYPEADIYLSNIKQTQGHTQDFSKGGSILLIYEDGYFLTHINVKYHNITCSLFRQKGGSSEPLEPPSAYSPGLACKQETSRSFALVFVCI